MDLHRELEIGERLARLENKVDFLLRELGLEDKERAAPPRPDFSDIEDQLRKGNKLEAVRRYRDRTGTSLAEATKAVEGIEHEIRGK
jgi:ribosomal protein L7/L12